MYTAWLFSIRSLSISLQKNYKTGKRKYPVDEENTLLLLLFFVSVFVPKDFGNKVLQTGWHLKKKKKNRNLSFHSSEAVIPKSRC